MHVFKTSKFVRTKNVGLGKMFSLKAISRLYRQLTLWRSWKWKTIKKTWFFTTLAFFWSAKFCKKIVFLCRASQKTSTHFPCNYVGDSTDIKSYSIIYAKNVVWPPKQLNARSIEQLNKLSLCTVYIVKSRGREGDLPLRPKK